jgi:hypothetical protein
VRGWLGNELEMGNGLPSVQQSVERHHQSGAKGSLCLCRFIRMMGVQTPDGSQSEQFFFCFLLEYLAFLDHDSGRGIRQAPSAMRKAAIRLILSSMASNGISLRKVVFRPILVVQLQSFNHEYPLHPSPWRIFPCFETIDNQSDLAWFLNVPSVPYHQLPHWVPLLHTLW